MKQLISRLLESKGISEPLPCEQAECLLSSLTSRLGTSTYPRSVVAKGGIILFLVGCDNEKFLGMASATKTPEEIGFSATRCEDTPPELNLNMFLIPTTPANASVLRKWLPFTAPRIMGLKKAIGCGDRLGIATPAHVRAVRGTSVVPFFAQQSIREMSRTHRTPTEVIDSATWGVFQEGWRHGYGADADHLKSTEDIDSCIQAGFTFYTIDPGEHVDSTAPRLDSSPLRAKYRDLPWQTLESTAEECLKNFGNKTFQTSGGIQVQFSETELLRAAVKYGRAVAHTARLYRHLVERLGRGAFELEVSVDETPSPTTTAEHYYVASELKRLDVEWVSLAPRFVGEFEKGVDYKGDLEQFESAYIRHVEIARNLGPYKMSIHSGSDKFSIYPVAARHSGELVHLKTAGTSYLEALRAVARIDPDLFREVLAFAFEHYEEDKASYHVSAQLSKVPRAEDLSDEELETVLDLFDGRQLLHVTYGSVLTAQQDGQSLFKDRILEVLRRDEETHYRTVEQHMRRHVEPFCT